MKITIDHLISYKKQKQKIVCLTAYSYPIAKILDEICDIILVGDSLGMTIYGFNDTTNVTMEMMINHGKAVTRACQKALIVIDMPYGSYELSKQQAIDNAKRIIDETECDAIKIETGKNIIPIAEFLANNNIPTIAHIGLMPQSVNKIGGYKYQGKDELQAKELIKDAIELEKCGIKAIVIEAVPAILASKITEKITIPTIGIGASIDCDGQVLVIDDLIGLNQQFKPKFVKNYCEIANNINIAAQEFAKEVRECKFPTNDHLLHHSLILE